MSRRALVAVVGDAGVKEGSPAYDCARAVGRLVVDGGMRIVTGGLGGVMEAACRGAHESAVYREGDTIGLLPQADPVHANSWVDIVLATNLDHLRNTLVANADAMIAVGGGAGTLSEIAFAWMYKRLIVAVTLGGWSASLAGKPLDHRRRLPEIDDDQIFAAHGADEAVRIVLERRSQYARRAHTFR